MDLFQTGNPTQDLIGLRDELKLYAKTNFPSLEKEDINSISIAYGNVNNIGSNILIVDKPVGSKKPFKSKYDKYLINLLKSKGLDKFFITYCYSIVKDPTTVSKKDIKNFSTWINRLVSIIQPKVIVVLGEEAELAFSKRKVVLKENHGSEIGIYNNIPIFLTYPMDYYVDSSGYEDESYKIFIQTNDWNKITEAYRSNIK